MSALMPQAKQQYFSNAGAPLVGGKVYTYAAGTTTPLATYTDASGSTPNTNPVILDSRGEASIFFGTASYKIVLKDAADATIWTQDNLAGNLALAALAASGGSALVGYLPSGTGAVPTTVQAKLRESVSVFDFMTAAQVANVKAGTPDDNYAAFTAALAASNNVTIPAGSYKTSGTLYFKDHVITGAGSQYFGGQNTGTLITCTGNVACFSYNGAYGSGTKITGIFIDYGDAIPASGSTKIGINIPNVAAWPAHYEFSDLRIRGAHIGINDAGASWHGRYVQVQAEKCRLGFYKLAGTDMVYEQCYALSGYQAYDIQNTIGAVFTACAFDNNTDPDAVPIFRAINVSGLVVNGMDQETNVLTANGNSMMKIDYCNGFLISGIGIVNNKISPAVGENYWMQISNTSIGEVVGCNTATLTYDKAGGGTTVYIIVVSNTASVAIKGCNLAEIIQTTTPSATRSVGNSGTGKVTLEATRTTDATSNVYLVSSALNGLLTQSAFNTSASQAVALVAGTPVTICSVAGYGTYLVTCYANNGNNTIYQSVSIVVNDGSLATITALKAGANNVLTLSGTNVQATCTGTTTGSYSVMKIA